MRVRREQQVEITVAGEEGVEPDRDQRPGGMHHAADLPVGPRMHEEPLAAKGEVRVIRNLEPHELPVNHEEGATPIEIEVFHDEIALEARSVMVDARDAEIAGSDLVHQLRVRQFLSTAKATNRAWITRLGHAARPEIGPKVDGVTVDPRIFALGGRHDKTVRYEAAAWQVELANGHRVASVGGERNERPRVVTRQQRRPGEHPLGTLASPEFIDVEQQLPVGGGRAVALQRGASPETTRMLAVPPEVVIVNAATAHDRDAIVGVDHLEKLTRQFFECGRSKPSERCFGLLGSPLEGSLPVDFFQPEVLVGHRISLRGLLLVEREFLG